MSVKRKRRHRKWKDKNPIPVMISFQNGMYDTFFLMNTMSALSKLKNFPVTDNGIEVGKIVDVKSLQDEIIINAEITNSNLKRKLLDAPSFSISFK